jgi:hypothetical protein
VCSGRYNSKYSVLLKWDQLFNGLNKLYHGTVLRRECWWEGVAGRLFDRLTDKCSMCNFKRTILSQLN